VDRIEEASPVTEEAAGLDFEAFFRAEYPRLVRTLFLLGADPTEAEDMAQEALARAYERWPRIQTMASPGGYVFRIALNLNRHRLRRLATRARRALDRERDRDQISHAELRTDVSRALASLPAGQREAVVLVEWLQMTSEEAGAVLRLSPASVRSRIHRAREVLKTRLENLGA